MIVDPAAATAAEPGRQPAAATGETLGKYRLDRVLGAGGMGVVWAAFDPDLERAVALKLLLSNDEPTLRSRLLREARAMARLKHPNVLTVYEVGTDKNRDYIAMEIVDGGTLDAWLDEKPPRPEIVQALLAAGRGLAAAHDAGLVHRDFKPHNVLRSKDGHVYVTDFGLARGQIEVGAEIESTDAGRKPVAALPEELGAGRKPVDILISPLTQTGVMIGTPAYMAPEQFAGRVPDARTDQWAFCVTAWEALTGARPFRGNTLPELEAAANAGVRELIVELTPRVRDVLARGLDPDPAVRWPDMRTLLAAFEAAFAEPRKRGRWQYAALAGLILVGGGVGLAYGLSRGGGDREELCQPPEVAFGDAWSDARRKAVLGVRPGGDNVAGVVILDKTRRSWLRAYDKACRERPLTQDVVERIRCLLRARDQIDAVTNELAKPGSKFEVMQMVPLTAAVELCRRDGADPDLDGGELEFRFDPEQFIPRGFPEPPAPPTAPGTPKPPASDDPWLRPAP